jgi:hypothetical protein
MYNQEVQRGRGELFGGNRVKQRLIAVATAVLGTVLIGGVVVVQPVAAADPVPTTVTLPLFGVPLTIDITTGPGGALTDVSVDPADNTVATQLRPHKVVFHSANPADPTVDPAKVVVRSKHGEQSVSARAGSLADVSGDGSWSGDVFGDGNASSVTFTIGGTDAAPDITGTTATPAAGITAEVGTVEHSTGDDEDESSASARVSVKFTTAAGDQSRTLTIKVKVGTDDDGDTSAKLSISLGRIKGVAIDAAAAAGPHTWTGLLCDGSTATINYTVAVDGSVSGVTTTPDTADVKTNDGKIDVRFSHNERVRIKVGEQDGLIKINVNEKIRCHSADPTTNVSTSIPGDDHQGDDGHDGHSDDGE